MPDSTRESPPSVLVIAFDEARQQSLTELLEANGYGVRLAHDEGEASGLIQEAAPDCIICDLSNPSKLDGYELFRRLKAGEATRLIPLVGVAEAPDLKAKLDALDAGADDLFAQPLNVDEVNAKLRALFRQRRLTKALESAENVIFALATAIEQKDDYTEGHGERVAIYARYLAEHVGLTEEEVQGVYTGGILHDIGKIGCPDAILNKPGPLTPDEFEIIKRHPVQGWEICRHLTSLGSCTLGCIRHHHERLDGSGYPDGLGGDNVPITVRIMSICDVFDALSTARAYKPAFPTKTSLKILTEEAERGWWDKDIVAAFVDMMRERELDSPKNRAKLEPLFVRPPSQGRNGGSS